MILLSESVDHAVYAKATRPAMNPGEHSVSIEEEAAALARRIRASNGGERQYNLGVLNSELRTLLRNQEAGYSGWESRIAVIRRTLELVGSF
jgi:hypothetical protein